MSLIPPANAQDFNCLWSGANADWDESAQWANCNGGIPNNNASTFSATINAGNVDIDSGTPNLEIENLNLNGGSIDHSSVTLTVKGIATLTGDYNLSNATLQGGNWVGNVSVVAGANAAIISTGIDPFSVAAASTFTIGNNSDLNVNGTIVNDGVFTFSSTSTAVDSFEITDQDINAATADLTLGGNGAIILNDNSARIDGGGYLVQQATHSITGVGGINNVTLDNQGTINANIDGGVLVISGTAVVNTGGTVQAENNGAISLGESAQISNGTLSTSTGGEIRFAAGANTALRDVTITGGSQLVIGNNTDANLGGIVNNDGTITFNSTSTAVDSLEVTDNDFNVATVDLTLAGTGNIVLNDDSAAIDGGGYILQQNGHSIEGFGNINGITLDNEGDINGNNALGELRLTNVQLNNAGGTIQAENGGAISVAGNTSRISNGTLSTATGGEIRFADGTNSELRDVVITAGSQLVIGNNTDANLGGVITNGGTITFNSTSTAVDSFEVTDNDVNAATVDLTLAGNGNVVLNDNSAAIDGGGYILQQTGHSIEGFGNINGISLDNQGVINGNNAAGELRLTNVLLNNTNGTIRAENGGAISVAGNTSRISNGTLSTASGGEIRFAEGGNSELRDVIITSGSNLVIGNNTDANLGGLIDNNGTITFNSTSTAIDSLEVTDNDVNSATVDLALTGNGNIVLNDNSARIDGNGYLSQGGNHSISGFGSIGSALLRLDTAGLISADVLNEQLIVDAVGNRLSAQPGLTNTGTLQAANGGTLELRDTRIENTGANITALADSTVALNQSGVTGGTLSSVGSGRIVVTSSTTGDIENVAITGSSVIEIGNNTTLLAAGNIVNDGTITYNSTTTSADALRITDRDANATTIDTTLSGTGVVVLNDSSAQIDGNGYLVHGANHRIEGFGRVGTGALQLDNAGVIDANVSGQRLLISTTGNRFAPTAGLTNTGTLQASSGGILELENGYLNNAGSIVLADNGSVVEIDRMRIDGGTLQSSGDGEFFFVNNQTSDVRDITIGAGSSLVIGNNTAVELTGNVSNSGDISYRSSTTSSDFLRINNVDGDINTVDLDLSGNGSITLNDNSNVIDGNGLLSHGSDHTIQGFGQVGTNGLRIENQGLITANTSGDKLLIDAAGSLSSAAAGVVNTGTIEARNGGILELQDSRIINSGSTIAARAGSVVEIDRSRIEGGALIGATGSEFFFVDGQQGEIADVTISSDARLVIGNNADLNAQGLITNNGLITYRSTTTSVDSFEVQNLDGDLNSVDATLAGSGTLVLNDNSAAIDGNGLLAHELTHTIQGFGQIGSNSLRIENAGLISANVLGEKLLIDPAGTTTTALPGLTNSGTIEAANGGILELQAARIVNSGGVIAARENSLVQIDISRIEGGALIGEAGSEFFVVDGQQSEFVDLSISNNALVVIGNNTDLNVQGVITNNGTITYRSTTTSIDSFEVQDLDNNPATVDATLAGNGSLILNNNSAAIDGNGLLVNEAGHTIAGFGQVGLNQTTLDNRGVVTANVSGQSLLVDTAGNGGSASQGLTNSGTLRAENGGSLVLESQNVSNNGTMEALDGSNVTMQPSAVLTNNVAGDLQGGVYRSVSSGNGAVIAINGDAITNNGAEIVLSGAGSVFQTRDGNSTSFTQLEDSLTSVSGTLRVLDNRDYSTANDLTISGIAELGGGTLDAASLSNSGEVFGFGTLADPVRNSGTVRAAGGTLQATVQSTGAGSVVQIDPNGALTLTGNSTASQLVHNGSAADSLNLQGFNVTVDQDYSNANFGSGNSFDGRANVVGAGQILAAGDTAQSISGDVSDGTTAAASISFGNIHVGDSVSRTYQVNNSGTSGADLRGAIQTAANGGNITDATLSGSGVTAQNFGPLATGTNTGDRTVTFSAADNSQAGALTGQQIAVVNNFDNVQNQTIALEGAAFRFANPEVNNAPIVLGNSHVGDVQGSTVSITNNVANDGFSESLNANVVGSSGNASGSGSFNLLAASQTNNSDISVALDTSAAGARTGSVSLGFVSDGSGTSELGQTALADQTITVSGDVYRFAEGAVANTPITVANAHIGDSRTANVAIANTAIADGFSEGLNANISGVDGNATGSGSVSLLAAGQTSNAISVTLDTSAAGARTGIVGFDFVSDGANNSGLGQTDIADRFVTVSGDVYRFAEGSVANTPITVANAHIGDSRTANVAIANTAIADGFSEGLNANISGVDGNATGSGSVSLLAAGQTSNAISVTLDTSAAGARTGIVGFDFVSDGANNSGLGQTDIADRFVTVSGNVYALANPVVQDSLNFGNVLVGSNQLQTISVLNDLANNDFNEDLNATWNSADSTTPPSGIQALLGQIFGLGAGEVDTSSLQVQLDTSSAGVVSATVTVDLESAGAVDGIANGLGITTLPGQPLTVQANIEAVVNNLAAAAVPTTNFAFGNAHVGDAIAQQTVRIENAAQAPAEGLNASIQSAFNGAVTNGGSISSLAAETFDDSSIAVGISSASAGAVNGTVTLAFESDGMANNGQTTQLQSRDVQVSGAIYALAAGSINGTAAGQPLTIDLGAARVGDANLSQSVTVTNTGVDSGGFTESLTASVTGVPTDFQINGNGGAGSTTSISQGGSEDVTVSLATTASGSFSGNQTVNFSSNEINGSGLGNTALASSDATLTGRIYQTAEAGVDRSSVNFGIVHVGDAVTAENITLTNTAGGALVDWLAGSFNTVDGPFFGAGTLGIGLQSGESGALMLDVDTSTAGIFSGQAGFGLLSQNDELADAAVAAAAIALDIQINEYANAIFEQSGGDGVLNGSGLNYILDFGDVVEGSMEQLLAELFITNDTTGPSDVLDGIFDLAGLSAEFMATGFNDFTGIDGGNSFNGLMLAFDTSGLGMGTYNSVINLTPFSRIPGQFNAQQGDISLTIQGRVVNANPVPVPGALLLILFGLVTLRLQRPSTKKSQ